jgi:hypothetical protein
MIDSNSIFEAETALEKALLIVGENMNFFDYRDIDELTDDDISNILLSYGRAAIFNDIVADYIMTAKKALDNARK